MASPLIPAIMIKNYFKIAWRYMWHNKAYSALNIAGLAAGMSVALLIGLWIYSQVSYDRFLSGYKDLYQVKLNFNYNGAIQTQTGASLAMIDDFKKNYSEVKHASETDWGASHSLVVGGKKLNPWGLQVGNDFLKMFSFPLLVGNITTGLDQPNSIILTETTARSLFGSEEAVNKIIRIDNQTDVIVTAVLKDLPANSTLQFSYLLPISFSEKIGARTEWQNYSYPEYVELVPGANVAAFEGKIKNMLAKHDPDHKIEVILQPAKNWRLLTEFNNGKATGGFIEYVRMFGTIGILVLLIACINFTNLCTARSEKRAREVGVRKAIGSQRTDLVIQFLSESLLITVIAFLVSLAIVQSVLPYFNSLTSGNISLPYTSPIFWSIMIGYVLFTGILAGSRPAFYLSSFRPVKVLKGTVQLGKRASLPHKILVVIQFSCSIALIIATVVIFEQIKYAKARPKGYDADQLVMNNASDDLNKNYVALKNDLLKSGKVLNVTSSASGMTYFPASFTLSNWPGRKENESLEMATTAVSKDYFQTVGMTLKAGRDFAGDTGADTVNMILNEAAVARLALTDPLNSLITFDYSPNPMRVIAVVKNAVIGSPFRTVSPAIFVYNPGWASSIMYRLKPTGNTQEALGNIAAIFNKYNPAVPFDYRFADEAFDAKFNLEVLIGRLAGIFAGLAIFISCLGLFGLAAYVAEQRKKEIGIRKVLGASVSEIWMLLSGNFLLLVIISCVIASPIAYYFLHGWLQKFEYRINIGPASFLLSACVAVIITIFTVSYQAINSALTNPVRSLRAE